MIQSRFWVITDSHGLVVAKFDRKSSQVPESITKHDNFNIVELEDRTSLSKKTVDQSKLSESELRKLAEVYPVNVE